MHPSIKILLVLLAVCVRVGMVYSQDDRRFRIFQFPSDKIPTIDGNSDDWDIVGEAYVVGINEMFDDRIDSNRHHKADPANLDVKVKVGWVNGINRIYILYEAYDNYWDFSLSGLHNDIFEVVIDGDQSGGPFINAFHPNKQLSPMDAYFSFHGVHAQNYHIFTPARGKDWAMVWGSQPWIKELPYANASYKYDFQPGEPGRLTLEFWITPFDYAGPEGPSRSVESTLTENKDIGLSWAVIDYDDVNKPVGNDGFWNLSRERTMYGDANYLLPFTLMPLEPQYLKPIDARWSFNVVDMNRRMVAFTDESIGEVTSWKWDFGDGNFSTEQHPSHRYSTAGLYIVTLNVEGPLGESSLSKVWDVAIK
ncbi:PKD domain-containing protein [Parapedobacter lycopersici]|uniref:PKD domain-containing protein n=1 Tax=Parapedobacter lycopersici TaxID=1864939 RepID=UPI003340B829